MSLAEIYAANFGEQPAQDEGTMTKEAADASLAAALESLTPEESEKLAQVVEVMDEEGIEFEHDLQKLAAAAEIVDEYEEYSEAEKTAAEEIEAGGRLFARAMVDELQKMEQK